MSAVSATLGNPLDHVRHALTLPFPQLRQAAPAEPGRPICLVGGGPSRARYLDHLRNAVAEGHEVWAVGGAYAWLTEQGIEPGVHILAMPDAEAANLVPARSEAILPYASQCHPEVFLRASAASTRVVVWHPMLDGIQSIPEFGESVIVGGGTTSGMMAITLAFIVGVREVHLFGYDSNYDDGTPVDPEDGEVKPDQKIYVQVDDRRYVSSVRFARQLNEFRMILRNLIPQGLGVHMHGDGLLPFAMQKIVAKGAPQQDNKG